MNIQINTETQMFGNDTYTDQTNSNCFEKVRIFIKQTNYFDSQSAALAFDAQNQQL